MEWKGYLSCRPDPTRPDPTRPDPTRPDPTRPDPTRPDPTRPDPTRPDPTRPDPTRPRPDPTRPEARRPDPTRPDPVRDGQATAGVVLKNCHVPKACSVLNHSTTGGRLPNPSPIGPAQENNSTQENNTLSRW